MYICTYVYTCLFYTAVNCILFKIAACVDHCKKSKMHACSDVRTSVGWFCILHYILIRLYYIN